MFDSFNGYNKNILLAIPKKQAKSYEIDLGQNNGAYDEELLIRYGDNTLNHMKNKTRGKNLNMDDILKMNEQLKPFQEHQIPADGVVSYKEMCYNIENNMSKIDEESKYLDEFEKNLNKSIEIMTNEIFKYFDDAYNEFNPELMEKYNYLKSKIKEQKDENSNLLKQIDFLLQENTQIMDMVYKVGSRLEKLENKAGIDKVQDLPNPNGSNNGSQIEEESELSEANEESSKSKSLNNNAKPLDEQSANNEDMENIGEEEGENEQQKSHISEKEEKEDGGSEIGNGSGENGGVGEAEEGKENEENNEGGE